MLAISWSQWGCVAELMLCTIGATLLHLHGDWVLCVLLLGTLEDMLRKAPDMGISLYRDPFTAEGNLESGRRLIYRGL